MKLNWGAYILSKFIMNRFQHGGTYPYIKWRETLKIQHVKKYDLLGRNPRREKNPRTLPFSTHLSHNLLPRLPPTESFKVKPFSRQNKIVVLRMAEDAKLSPRNKVLLKIVKGNFKLN